MDWSISLLARETNWMETASPVLHSGLLWTLFSQEKLIEWKLGQGCRQVRPELLPNSLLARETNWMETIVKTAIVLRTLKTLFSQEKLIEWKLRLAFCGRKQLFLSLLARETNWMETVVSYVLELDLLFSLLARETNWMETKKPHDEVLLQWFDVSLLARETNWMETGVSLV